jgi:hypothetical protein
VQQSSAVTTYDSQMFVYKLHVMKRCTHSDRLRAKFKKSADYIVENEITTCSSLYKLAFLYNCSNIYAEKDRYFNNSTNKYVHNESMQKLYIHPFIIRILNFYSFKHYSYLQL